MAEDNNRIAPDVIAEGQLRNFLERSFPSYKYRSRKDELTILNGATDFHVTSNYMVLTGAAAVTIARIIGGYEGQSIVLGFTDGNVTITDDASGNAVTVNLSAAFTGSANDIIELMYNGTSWREVSRSVN